MSKDRFFKSYSGETTEQLLGLVNEYRIDSLVLAFEQAIQLKAVRAPISRQERYVLAIEALEREVNNGGYSQFFLNSSHEFVDTIEEALKAIGCPKV
jgi:ferredoxin-NADP reductase